MGNKPPRGLSRYLLDPLKRHNSRHDSELGVPRKRNKYSLASNLAQAALQENEIQRSNRERRTLVWVVCLLSQLGLIFSVFSTIQMTAHPDVTDSDKWSLKNPNGWVRISVVIVPASTLLTAVFLMRYYQQEGARKIMEWQSELAEFHFWKSSLPLVCLGEILLHVPQPVPGLDVDDGAFAVLEALMMVRIYTAFRPFVLLYREYFLTNNRAQMHKNTFALHLMLHRHTFGILSIVMMLVVACCSFLLFLFERNTTESFQRLTNIWWFAFVTSTTIGYGDMYPLTMGGRLMTVFMSCWSLVIVNAFCGVITNKLAPSKEMVMQMESERMEQARLNLERAAAQLIQAVWLDSNGRKSNYYKALKSFRQRRGEMALRQRAQDPVVEERLQALIERVEKVERGLKGYFEDLQAVKGALEQVLLVSNALLDQDEDHDGL